MRAQTFARYMLLLERPRREYWEAFLWRCWLDFDPVEAYGNLLARKMVESGEERHDG